MALKVSRADVWAATIPDRPGGLGRKLAPLAATKANFEFVIARRTEEKPGMGVVFVTPLRGDREIAAAARLGFNVTNSVHCVRVGGDNRPGAAAEVTEKLTAAGINLRGFSAAVIGPRFIFYIGLDNAADAEKAANILQQT